jgi:four helix bundle protein
MNNDIKSRSEILEDRLIDFALLVNKIIVLLPDTYLGRNLSGQLIRSSTSPALNYGEEQAASSTKDYIHKMRICLKELRETNVGLKIIDRGGLINNQELLDTAKKECGELIAIFVTSINTANNRL